MHVLMPNLSCQASLSFSVTGQNFHQNSRLRSYSARQNCPTAMQIVCTKRVCEHSGRFKLKTSINFAKNNPTTVEGSPSERMR